MLARTAQGIYWMSRYLERAQHLCGMLKMQSEALVDRPIREIHLGWNRIYVSVGRMPPAGSTVLVDDDDYMLADSYTLADDLTFERTNPDSVWNCFAQGRENARQMRQSISAEMWSCLNVAYLQVQGMNIQDIWRESPEGFYTWMVSQLDTFAGIASATMYRDEGWRFMQLGYFIERAQLLSGLLNAQLELDEIGSEYSDGDWTSLLRLYHALEAHNRIHGIEVKPESVIELLSTDILLPGSLIRSLDMASYEVSAIGDGPDKRSSDEVNEHASRLTYAIQNWKDQPDKRALLARVNADCRELHQLVNQTYFDYSSENSNTD